MGLDDVGNRGNVVAAFAGIFIIAGYKKGKTQCKCEDNAENARQIFHMIVLLYMTFFGKILCYKISIAQFLQIVNNKKVMDFQ